MDAGQVMRLVEQLQRRFTAFHERVEDRRLHFHNDPAKDPKLGSWSAGADGKLAPDPDNPFRDMTAYQADNARRVAQDLIPRLTANHVVANGTAQKSSEQKIADDLATVLNSWIWDIEARTQVNLQQQISFGQSVLGYAVLHVRRADDMWPARERMKRETARSYSERVEYERAKRGAPWVMEAIDPSFFACAFDRNPVGGMAAAVLSYEVGLLDYVEAVERDEMSAQEALEKLQIMAETPAPGLQDAGVTSVIGADGPSSGDFDKRVTVHQFWTREMCYEIMDRGGDNNFEEVKAWPHEYEQVPFRIIPCTDTGDPDPVRRWLPAMEGIFRLKPFFDRFLTLTAGMAELTAMPLQYMEKTGTAPAPLLESGDPANEAADTAGAGIVPDGFTMKQLKIEMGQAIAGVMQMLTDQLTKSEPGTGQADYTATTAPWLMRLAQTQANVGPKLMITNANDGFKWALNLIVDWHVRHPEEAMVAFERDDEGAVSSYTVKRVDPKELTTVAVGTSISPVASSEQITLGQVLAEYLGQGLIKREDFYRDGLGKTNPQDYINALDAETAMRPAKQAWSNARIAAELGSLFMQGMNGATLSAQGQEVPPEQALMANGWQPQVAPTGPSMGGGEALGQTTPGPLPQLAAPGTVPLQGLAG